MIQLEHLTLACCLFTLSKENFIFPMLSFIFTGKTLAVCGSCYPSVVLKPLKEPMDSQHDSAWSFPLPAYCIFIQSPWDCQPAQSAGFKWMLSLLSFKWTEWLDNWRVILYATGKIYQPEAVCRWQSMWVLPWPWYSVMTAIIGEEKRML